MGTTCLITANAFQALGIKTILGSFFVMLIIIALHASQKHSQRLSMITFLLIIGIVTIGSLILFTMAIDTMIHKQLAGAI
jgi:EamA domain-containing membrane protein RarD